MSPRGRRRSGLSIRQYGRKSDDGPFHNGIRKPCKIYCQHRECYRSSWVERDNDGQGDGENSPLPYRTVATSDGPRNRGPHSYTMIIIITIVWERRRPSQISRATWERRKYRERKKGRRGRNVGNLHGTPDRPANRPGMGNRSEGTRQVRAFHPW